LAHDIPGIIDVCTHTSEDFAALGKWIDQFDSKATAKAIVTKNFKDNQVKIMKDLGQASGQFHAKGYFKAGTDLGDALVKALGPVVPSPLGYYKSKRMGDPSPVPTDEVINWAAGVAYEFVKINNLPEFKVCFEVAGVDYPNLK